MQSVTVFCIVLSFAVTFAARAPTTPTTTTTTASTTTESMGDIDYELMAAAYCDIMKYRYKSWEHYQYAKLVARGFYRCYYPDVFTHHERNAMTGCQTIAYGGQLDDPFTFHDSVCVGPNAMTPNNPKVVMHNACLTTVYYWLYPETAVTDNILLELVDTIGVCQFLIVFPNAEVDVSLL